MYKEKADLKEYEVNQIRFFCLGKELKDELFIYSYDIKDEMTIQAMFKKTWCNYIITNILMLIVNNNIL